MSIHLPIKDLEFFMCIISWHYTNPCAGTSKMIKPRCCMGRLKWLEAPHAMNPNHPWANCPARPCRCNVWFFDARALGSSCLKARFLLRGWAGGPINKIKTYDDRYICALAIFMQNMFTLWNLQIGGSQESLLVNKRLTPCSIFGPNRFDKEVTHTSWLYPCLRTAWLRLGSAC